MPNDRDYLDPKDYYDFEEIEGCNCMYCRMARMEKKMTQLTLIIQEMGENLQLQQLHDTAACTRGKGKERA